MSKKELVLRAIRGETVERILVGFLAPLCDPRRRIGSRQSGCSRKKVLRAQHHVEEISPGFCQDHESDGFSAI